MKKIKISEEDFKELEENIKQFVKILEPIFDIFGNLATMILEAVPPELIELAKEMKKWEKNEKEKTNRRRIL